MIVFFIISFSSTVFAEDTISPEKSKEIIEKIYTRIAPMFKKYQGIEYKRTEITKEYNPSSNKLLSTTTTLLLRREYFYQKPSITVLEYEKDGKKLKPSDYEEARYPPLYHPFDEKGKDRYTTEVKGYETIEGIVCYKIKVTPKEATERHFKGYFYFDAKNLDLIKAGFTLGKLPFGFIKLFIEASFSHSIVREVAKTGRFYIPFIFNKKFVHISKTITAKPILY